MSGKLDKVFQCREEVRVTVRNDVDKDRPVGGNRVRRQGLLDDLAEVDCGGVVVILESRVDLVEGFFTLEKHGATKAWNYIVHFI